MNNIWVFGDSFSMDMNKDVAEFSELIFIELKKWRDG